MKYFEFKINHREGVEEFQESYDYLFPMNQNAYEVYCEHARRTTLLKLCIRKWLILAYHSMMSEAIRDGGIQTCACCLRYNHSNEFHACIGCPIKKYNHDRMYCESTPYATYNDVIDEEGGLPAYLFMAAKAEVRFLREVLKEVEDENQKAKSKTNR